MSEEAKVPQSASKTVFWFILIYMVEAPVLFALLILLVKWSTYIEVD